MKLFKVIPGDEKIIRKHIKRIDDETVEESDIKYIDNLAWLDSVILSKIGRLQFKIDYANTDFEKYSDYENYSNTFFACIITDIRNTQKTEYCYNANSYLKYLEKLVESYDKCDRKDKVISICLSDYSKSKSTFNVSILSINEINEFLNKPRQFSIYINGSKRGLETMYRLTAPVNIVVEADKCSRIDIEDLLGSRYSKKNRYEINF